MRTGGHLFRDKVSLANRGTHRLPPEVPAPHDVLCSGLSPEAPSDQDLLGGGLPPHLTPVAAAIETKRNYLRNDLA